MNISINNFLDNSEEDVNNINILNSDYYNTNNDNVPLISANIPLKKSFNNIDCPITIALKKTGGYTAQQSDNLVIIGGEEIITDSAIYFIILETIEVARFEAKYTHAPKDEQDKAIAEIKARLFANMGADMVDAYSALFSRVLVNSPLLIEQLSRIVILIARISETRTSGTLYDFALIKDAGFILPRRPDALKYQLDALYEFLKKFANIDIIPPVINIPVFPANEKIADIATVEDVKRTFEQKLAILRYMSEVEQVQAIAIRYMENIINKLLQTLQFI